MYGLLVLNFIIPFVMVFVGYILKKHPVKDMTSGNGYNTPTYERQNGAAGHGRDKAGGLPKT